jgi:DNA topoisomerase-1
VKVFRTYNASITLERELSGMDENLSLEEKIVFYNRANKEVALLCNHKRSLPPTHVDSMRKLEVSNEETKTKNQMLVIYFLLFG